MSIYHYTRFVDIKASIAFASENDKERFIAAITNPSVTDGFSGYYTGEDFISLLSNRFKNDLDDDDPSLKYYINTSHILYDEQNASYKKPDRKLADILVKNNIDAQFSMNFYGDFDDVWNTSYDKKNGIVSTEPHRHWDVNKRFVNFNGMLVFKSSEEKRKFRSAMVNDPAFQNYKTIKDFLDNGLNAEYIKKSDDGLKYKIKSREARYVYPERILASIIQNNNIDAEFFLTVKSCSSYGMIFRGKQWHAFYNKQSGYKEETTICIHKGLRCADCCHANRHNDKYHCDYWSFVTNDEQNHNSRLITTRVYGDEFCCHACACTDNLLHN